MHQRAAAMSRKGRAGLGAALCLPVLVLLTLLLLGVKPPIPAIERLRSREGSLVAFGLFALVPVALAINVGPALRRAPVNLAAALFALGTIVVILSLIAVDQYPCWVGVPNCD